MGMVATPIPAAQQMPLHWMSLCVGTEDRVGETGDTLSSEGTTWGPLWEAGSAAAGAMVVREASRGRLARALSRPPEKDL